MRKDWMWTRLRFGSKLAILFWALTFLANCDEQTPSTGGGSSNDSVDVLDIDELDVDDASDRQDTDPSQDAADIDDITVGSEDSSEEGDVSALPSFFFRESYLCDATGAPASRRAVGYTFRELDRGGGGPINAQHIRDLRGGEIDVDGGWMTAPSELDPGNNGYAVWAKEGEDVTLYSGTFTKEAQLSGATLSVTAMVDYQPVSATYRRWDPEREQVIEETTATGIRVPMDNQVEVVDIVIPAETFDENRMYDLAVAYVADGQDKWIQRNFYRVTLYAGGYDLPTHPCFEPTLPSERKSIERDIMDSRHFGTVTLYPSDLNEPSQLKSPIPASPGERVTVKFFVRDSTSPIETSIGLVPLLNSKPLDKRWFYVRPSAENTSGSIQYRGEFEVTLPSEPGIHEITMTRWEFPFLPIENVRGIKTDTPYMRHGGGSRTLRFEVQ